MGQPNAFSFVTVWNGLRDMSGNHGTGCVFCLVFWGTSCIGVCGFTSKGVFCFHNWFRR